MNSLDKRNEMNWMEYKILNDKRKPQGFKEYMVIIFEYLLQGIIFGLFKK
jgi:hypothetical protein